MAAREFDFSVILSGIPELTDEHLDLFHAAGCDDALFGQKDGVTFADFTRRADSLREAVVTAIRDIQRAGAGATVVHVEPDEFVTMSEIARRLEVSREGVRKWVLGTRGPGRFPPPAGHLSEKSPLWRWSDVLGWYRTGGPKSATRTGPPVPRRSTSGSSKRTSGKVRPTHTHPAPPQPEGHGDILSVESAADVAALNAALDLLRYAGSERAAGLLQELASL